MRSPEGQSGQARREPLFPRKGPGAVTTPGMQGLGGGGTGLPTRVRAGHPSPSGGGFCPYLTVWHCRGHTGWRCPETAMLILAESTVIGT